MIANYDPSTYKIAKVMNAERSTSHRISNQ
jgi:hypothetical protein